MGLNKELQELAHEWMREHNTDVIDPDAVFEWAIRMQRYQRRPPSLQKQFKRDLARALRDEKFIDEDGNEVRRMHAIRRKGEMEQIVMWIDIQTAKPQPMRVSLQQRRRGIFFDCRQHRNDTNWYNKHNQFDATLPPFDYNFNPDLEEMDLPTDYPESAPEREEDDTEE